MPIARLHTATTTSSSSTTQQSAPSTSTKTQEKVVLQNLKTKSDKKITWSEEVEDNEFKNMRTSKKCCIFHKKKEFGESDSESDSESEHDCHDHHCEHHHQQDTSNSENDTSSHQ